MPNVIRAVIEANGASFSLFKKEKDKVRFTYRCRESLYPLLHVF